MDAGLLFLSGLYKEELQKISRENEVIFLLSSFVKVIR